MGLSTALAPCVSLGLLDRNNSDVRSASYLLDVSRYMTGPSPLRAKQMDGWQLATAEKLAKGAPYRFS